MKVQKPVIVIAFMLMFGFTKAQTNADWKPLWLTSTNMFKGVEGFYQVASCSGAEVVALKFVNHNTYGIKAGWKNVAITKDDQRHPVGDAQDSLAIPASTTIEGNCSNAQLLVKFSSLGVDIASFKAFVAAEFNFVNTH